jgi:cyclophilin family peptidyl-prolyl cis-trans isomerase
LAIVSLNSHTEFFKSRTTDFVDLYKKAILLGDPAVTGIVSGALADSMLAYRKIIPDFTFLLDARKRLELPKDIESLQPLTEAIAYFEGRPKPIALKNTYNHPIPWELVRTIPGDQKVRVKTARGEIVLRLFVEETPGSVGNFVQLVRQKYFDGKFVHRVVPNFVTQTGCNRGDGYGSEAFSIRSEFSRRRYSTGSVGMASAGKDTEGTQWFITHSPTPHLDGRYTLFAEVVKGQNIVDQLQVGDTIETVSLIGN